MRCPLFGDSGHSTRWRRATAPTGFFTPKGQFRESNQRDSDRAQTRESLFLMNITLSLAPLISLIAGILILVVPRLLSYIVAIYLIVIGLIGVFGAGNFHM